MFTLTGAAKADTAGSASSPPVQFVQKLGEILQKNFDVHAIGRFALGTHWKDASEAQQEEYMKLFEDMIVQTYTTRFEDYSGQTLKVDGSTPYNEKDSIVSSQVLQKDGPPINLQWRIRNEDGALRVVDVIVEGISMSITQRSDFSATIQNGGGNIDTFLSSMREHEKNRRTFKN